MSGDWPPEDEFPEDEFPEEADQLDAETEARLSVVTAYLASVPAPVLPEAVAARISAALAAEAAARAGDGGQSEVPAPVGSAAPGTAEPADDARTLPPAPARARVRRHRRGGGGRRALRSRPLVVVGSVVVCLILAGLGYGLSHDSGSPAASSSLSIASGSAGKSNAAGAPEAPAGSGSSAAGASGAAGVSFVVTASGTGYHAATLAAQARARLAASSPGSVRVPGPSSAPAAGPGSLTAGPASTPAAALRGCVARLTGGLAPRLVDRATYQGKPAYIIVGSTKVWVVGLNCTAGNEELIASVPLGT